MAAIVDLGTPDELRQRYGFEEAAEWWRTGFASLHLKGDKIMILQARQRQVQEYQPLQEGPKLFTELAAICQLRRSSWATFTLCGLLTRKTQSFQQLVKLMVIAYRPEEAVTLRWELL